MNLPWDKITKIAAEYHHSPYLIAAIVQKESGGLSNSIRYEAHYKDLWKVPEHAKLHAISKDTEESLQKHSYGIMQVMGATARWLGFTGPLTDLLDHELSLVYGCRYITYLKNRFQAGPKVISAYNFGHVAFREPGVFKNQEYVTDVLNYYQELSGLPI